MKYKHKLININTEMKYFNLKSSSLLTISTHTCLCWQIEHICCLHIRRQRSRKLKEECQNVAKEKYQLWFVVIDPGKTTNFWNSSTFWQLGFYLNPTLSLNSLFSTFGPNVGVWPDCWVSAHLSLKKCRVERPSKRSFKHKPFYEASTNVFQ